MGSCFSSEPDNPVKTTPQPSAPVYVPKPQLQQLQPQTLYYYIPSQNYYPTAPNIAIQTPGQRYPPIYNGQVPLQIPNAIWLPSQYQNRAFI